MFAGAKTNCPICVTKSGLEKKESKYNSSCPLAIVDVWVCVAPTCSVTNITLIHISSPPRHRAVTVPWQSNVFEL